MAQKIFVVDAFMDRAFGRNPAAVCILKGPRDDEKNDRVLIGGQAVTVVRGEIL